MELQFQLNKIPCLRQLKSEVQTQEQTQEIRIQDSLPDIGRVLAAWGQVVVRGKEWRGDDMGVSCGVTAWVLYAPEDGSQAQCVECWIPMNMKWSLPETETDGNILCHCLLKSVDARTLSGRKLMVRAAVSAMAQAYVPWEVDTYQPDGVPKDIALLQKTYPVCLVREAGEKAFVMDEEMTVPASAPALDKIVRYSLQPEVTDQKVLGDKAVFRGNTTLHVLYRTAEGAMASWDFEIPFSQYTELRQEYGHQAQVQIMPLVTSVELEAGEQGRLRLKAGIAGQYLLSEICDICVVEDGYSGERTVNVKQEVVEIPAVLEWQQQRIHGEQQGNFGSSRVADISFYPGFPRKQRKSDSMEMEIPGVFQTLYYDGEGVLQSSLSHWQTGLELGLDDSASMDAWCSAVGKTQASPGEESTALRGALMLDTVTHTVQNIPMVTALTVGDAIEKDPLRPSLILRKAGTEDLWTIAKSCGSTVEAIREANALSSEPDPEQMLLIPVL